LRQRGELRDGGAAHRAHIQLYSTAITESAAIQTKRVQNLSIRGEKTVIHVGKLFDETKKMKN
jgi:hypothetical protein